MNKVKVFIHPQSGAELHVTDDGVIFHKAYRNQHRKSWRMNQLKPHHSYSSAYLIVNFREKGKEYALLIHRLVLEAFVGPCPHGCEADHINCDPHDNRLENLRWLDSRQNRDRRRGRKWVQHFFYDWDLTNSYYRMISTGLITLRKDVSRYYAQKALYSPEGTHVWTLKDGSVLRVTKRRKEVPK